MTRFQKILFLVAAVFSFSASHGFAQSEDGGSSPTTFIAFVSQPGEYIGAGQTRLYTPANGNFQIRYNYNNNPQTGVRLSYDEGFGGAWWDASFDTGVDQPLSTNLIARYATRFPFNAFGVPGLSFSGSGRGCNQLSGFFTVSEYQVNPATGVIERFAADFAQFCENLHLSGPGLFGAVRYNSSAPVIIRNYIP